MRISMSVALAVFVLSLAQSVAAKPAPISTDPVLAKLERVADLTDKELISVINLYTDLYLALEKVGPRPPGRTNAEQRQLIKAAYKQHRKVSLEYLRPNQYRRWMTVAGRLLPKPSPSGGYSTNFSSGTPFGYESPATAMYRAS